jgi:hypothetical protein
MKICVSWQKKKSSLPCTCRPTESCYCRRVTASSQSDPTSSTSFGTNDGTVQGVASNIVHCWHHNLHNYVRLKRKVLQYTVSWCLTQWNNVGFSEVVSFTSSHIRPTAPVLEPCLFLQPPKKTFLEVQNRKSEAVRTTETLMTIYQSTFRDTWTWSSPLLERRMSLFRYLRRVHLVFKLCILMQCGINV